MCSILKNVKGDLSDHTGSVETRIVSTPAQPCVIKYTFLNSFITKLATRPSVTNAHRSSECSPESGGEKKKKKDIFCKERGGVIIIIEGKKFD